MEEELKQKAKEIEAGRTDPSVEREVEAIERISPLEEARKIKEETAQLLENIRKERTELQRTTEELALAGQTFAGSRPKEKTADEKANEEAAKILRMFR